jgi:hypothetical protein
VRHQSRYIASGLIVAFIVMLSLPLYYCNFGPRFKGMSSVYWDQRIASESRAEQLRRQGHVVSSCPNLDIVRISTENIHELYIIFSQTESALPMLRELMNSEKSDVRMFAYRAIASHAGRADYLWEQILARWHSIDGSSTAVNQERNAIQACLVYVNPRKSKSYGVPPLERQNIQDLFLLLRSVDVPAILHGLVVMRTSIPYLQPDESVEVKNQIDDIRKLLSDHRRDGTIANQTVSELAHGVLELLEQY